MKCPVCRRALGADVVNPGPEWGPTDRACFEAVDLLAEALERVPLAPLPDDLERELAAAVAGPRRPPLPADAARRARRAA
jgi:hypothetical protein